MFSEQTILGGPKFLKRKYTMEVLSTLYPAMLAAEFHLARPGAMLTYQVRMMRQHHFHLDMACLVFGVQLDHTHVMARVAACERQRSSTTLQSVQGFWSATPITPQHHLHDGGEDDFGEHCLLWVEQDVEPQLPAQAPAFVRRILRRISQNEIETFLQVGA